MPRRAKPREIIVTRSYLFRGRPINLVEQVPDGVICCRLDDDDAPAFTLRWAQFGQLGEEVPDA